MRILIICRTMTYFSGSPLYNYTLAIELKKQGHDVSVYSMWNKNELVDGFADAKIMTFYKQPTRKDGKFDLVIISQPDLKDALDEIEAKKIINIVHSEYDVETPITDKRIDKYVVIRPSIKEHLIRSHGIKEENIKVVYNGIDFSRFSKSKRIINKNDYVKVVIPCTIDMLRIKFLEYYSKLASKQYRVFIYGKAYSNSFTTNEWVFVNNEVFDIENYIADADIVAGILLGRINLEARAMGIVSIIHNPDDPEEKEIYFPETKEFNKRHDIINVAKNILKV